jgi:hypothetical protein
MADINILMVGGRRTGKTSVLASMLDGFQDIFAGKSLTITSEIGTNPVLQCKLSSLRNIFVSHGAYDEFDPGANAEPNSGRIDYKFNVKIAGKKGSDYSLRFTDVPGEWFIEDAAFHATEVESLFDESNIMIIAVDTPHLMECDERGLGYGKYHETFNGTGVFTNNIMDKFIVKDKLASKKMVLFMPLKCEKYFRENRVHEIPKAIEKGYENLLKHLGGENLKNNCVVAILPIQTMSNFEFSRFEEDEIGSIIVHQLRHVPMYSLYRFPNESLYNEGLKPKYCEQPLVYILSYVLKMAQSVGTANLSWYQKFIAFLGILKIAKDKEVQEAISGISSKIERNPSKGFKIIQNPLNI